MGGAAEGALGRHLLAHRGEPPSKKKRGGGGGGSGGADESRLSATSGVSTRDLAIDVFEKREGSSSAALTPHQVIMSSHSLLHH